MKGLCYKEAAGSTRAIRWPFPAFFTLPETEANNAPPGVWYIHKDAMPGLMADVEAISEREKRLAANPTEFVRTMHFQRGTPRHFEVVM